NKFDRGNHHYQNGVRGILARKGRFVLVFLALTGVMALLFARMPSSFLPNEDQGVAMAMIDTPIGATQERTLESIYELEDHFLTNEPDAVNSIFTLQGFSFAGAGQNSGMA